jgi:Zn-dependent protease with chaperone function
MGKTKVEISPEFKKKTARAVRSIVLFVMVYLVLVALSIGLMLVCGYLGILLILHGRIFSIFAGAGIIAMSLFVLGFLVKFMFKRHQIERDGMTEITENEHPMLFQLIREVANEVHTDFPKHIYLTENVNASVFYDSIFWSMFFPIRKNLQIGMGLMNSLTITEFKAVLAHEFGHFSQDSMRVGNYVYNVNQVVYNGLV